MNTLQSVLLCAVYSAALLALAFADPEPEPQIGALLNPVLGLLGGK